MAFTKWMLRSRGDMKSNKNGLYILTQALLDWYFALVDDAGDVAPEDREALAAAKARGASVSRLTAAEMACYFPGRSRSFDLADVTPDELQTCYERVIFTNAEPEGRPS